MQIRSVAVAVLLGAAAPALAGDAPPVVAAGTPGFALRGFEVRDVEASGATLVFDAEVSNPTAAAVALAGVTFGLEVDGKRVVEGTLADGADVPPGGKLAIAFPGRIRYADLPGIAAKTALGRKVPFKLVATAQLRTPAGTLAVPVVYDGELSMPQRPGVGLHGLRIVSMNPFDAAIEVSVAVENENAFPLPAGSLQYRITIAGGDISSAQAALPEVAPRGKAVVAIPLKLSLRKVGRGVVQALKGDAAMVGLHAVATLAGLAWPVDLEARLPTRR